MRIKAILLLFFFCAILTEALTVSVIRRGTSYSATTTTTTTTIPAGEIIDMLPESFYLAANDLHGANEELVPFDTDFIDPSNCFDSANSRWSPCATGNYLVAYSYMGLSDADAITEAKNQDATVVGHDIAYYGCGYRRARVVFPFQTESTNDYLTFYEDTTTGGGAVGTLGGYHRTRVDAIKIPDEHCFIGTVTQVVTLTAGTTTMRPDLALYDPDSVLAGDGLLHPASNGIYFVSSHKTFGPSASQTRGSQITSYSTCGMSIGGLREVVPQSQANYSVSNMGLMQLTNGPTDYIDFSMYIQDDCVGANPVGLAYQNMVVFRVPQDQAAAVYITNAVAMTGGTLYAQASGIGDARVSFDPQGWWSDADNAYVLPVGTYIAGASVGCTVGRSIGLLQYIYIDDGSETLRDTGVVQSQPTPAASSYLSASGSILVEVTNGTTKVYCKYQHNETGVNRTPSTGSSSQFWVMKVKD